MVRAAGGLVSVTDIPVMGTPVDIVVNTAGGYVGGLAQARLFVGGTHVILSGTIEHPTALARAAVIGTIPAELRPSQTRRLACALGPAAPSSGTSGTSSVLINTNGTIQLTGSSDTIAAQRIAFLDAIMYAL
jgi:hypothetical protein